MEDADVANLEPKTIGKLSQNMCSILLEILSVMSANFGNSLGGRKRQNYKGNLGITLGMLQINDKKKKKVQDYPYQKR